MATMTRYAVETSTMTHGRRFGVRWADVAAVTMVAVATVLIALALFDGLASEVDNGAPGHGTMPRCSDAIADTRGMCQGEP